MVGDFLGAERQLARGQLVRGRGQEAPQLLDQRLGGGRRMLADHLLQRRVGQRAVLGAAQVAEQRVDDGSRPLPAPAA